jgi:hypothetical protein
VPNQPKTPLQNIRIDKELWAAFREVASPDRSEVLRQFIRWYVREPGAKLPPRTTATPGRS